MDDITGALAFAVLIIAQFLAVVAVSKWSAGTSATESLHRRAMPAGAICVERRENKIAPLCDPAAAGPVIHTNSLPGEAMARMFRFFGRWRAARVTARQRRIQDIAKKGLAAID